MNEIITEEKALKEIKKNEKHARKVLGSPDRFKKFFKKTLELLSKCKFTEEIKKYILSFGQLMASYWKKEYKEVDYVTILKIVGTLIYVINPFDLIPDFIPGIGQIDDTAIILSCVKSIKEDLDKYMDWREENKKDETDPIAVLDEFGNEIQ